MSREGGYCNPGVGDIALQGTEDGGREASEKAGVRGENSKREG